MILKAELDESIKLISVNRGERRDPSAEPWGISTFQSATEGFSKDNGKAARVEGGISSVSAVLEI